MKTFLVFAHPRQGSFNHALKDVAESSLKHLQVSDLYAMHFKAAADWNDFEGEEFSSQYTAAQKEAFLHGTFAPDIQEEQKKLLECGLLILQFPLWWFSMPAILKGWLDRILAKGLAYDKDKWFNKGPLRGKKAMLVVTTQSPESSYTVEGLHQRPIEMYLQHIHHTLKFVGFSLEEPFVAYGADGGPDSLRQSYLEQYRERLVSLQAA